MNRQSAIMVKLSIFQWSGKATDNRAAETAQSVYHAEHRSGRYEKKLLPGALTLEAIQRLASEIRNWHYHVTLPWEDEGWRIIPSAKWMEYATELRSYRERWDSAVASFIEAYPNLIQLSKACLGEMWNEAEYPSVEVVAAMFRLVNRIQPIPNADDLRIGGDTDIAARVREEAKLRLEESIIASQRDVVERIRAAFGAVVERLGDPDARFKKSLFENMRKLSALIPRLMIEPDPAIEVMARKLAEMSTVDAETVRESPDYRAQVAADAETILKVMTDAYGEAANV